MSNFFRMIMDLILRSKKITLNLGDEFAIEIAHKTLAIIKSCKNVVHWEIAENYIKLYDIKMGQLYPYLSDTARVEVDQIQYDINTEFRKWNPNNWSLT